MVDECGILATLGDAHGHATTAYGNEGTAGLADVSALIATVERTIAATSGTIDEGRSAGNENRAVTVEPIAGGVDIKGAIADGDRAGT